MNLVPNRQGSLVSKNHRECTRCGVIYPITNDMTICKPCNTARVKSRSPEQKMLARAKSRAKDFKLPFNLTIEDIVIPKVCPIMGIPLIVHVGKSGTYPDSPSLDKIVPELGYIKGNVQVISSMANMMKGYATKAELITFAKSILKLYGEDVTNPPEHK